MPMSIEQFAAEYQANDRRLNRPCLFCLSPDRKVLDDEIRSGVRSRRLLLAFVLRLANERGEDTSQAGLGRWAFEKHAAQHVEAAPPRPKRRRS